MAVERQHLEIIAEALATPGLHGAPCAQCGRLMDRPALEGAQPLHQECLTDYLVSRMAEAAPPWPAAVKRRRSLDWDPLA